MAVMRAVPDASVQENAEVQRKAAEYAAERDELRRSFTQVSLSARCMLALIMMMIPLRNEMHGTQTTP